jgi:hypothetical protein
VGDPVYVQVSGRYNLPAVDRWAVDPPTGDPRMRRLLAVALAAPLALLFASPATADQGPPPRPLDACGGTVTVETIVDTTRFIETKSGFQIVGNGVVRLSDQNSSADIRIPGRVSFSGDETGTRIVLTGRNLLIPDTESLRAALADAGLPDIALITGRVVILETFDEETGTVTDRIVSATPKVTDVCALLN